MAGVTSVVIDGTTYLVDDINAVDFSEDQGLSEQQQQQGRSNIGAAAYAALAGKADKADLNALAGTVGELTEALADKASAIVDTASGAIASFPDGMAAPAKDVTIGIEPVQTGSGDPSPTNVRPISGWTGANVTRTGFNFFNGVTQKGGLAYSTGIEISNTHLRRSEYLPVVPSIRYYFGSINTAPYIIVWYDENKNYIQTNEANPTKFQTSPNNAKFVRIAITNNNYATNWDTANICINISDPAKNGTYEPGHVITYPISWQSEAGTVYGGSLDVTTGLLTVTMAEVDLGTLNWVKDSQSRWFGLSDTGQIPNIKGVTNNDEIANIICTNYRSTSRNNITSGNGICVNVQNSVLIADSYMLANYDAAAFKTAMSGVYLVYELAAPQTYQLSPTEVDTLLGENNVWADTGDSTVAYRADTKLYIQKINAPTDADMIADAQIASGRYFIVGGNLYRSTTTIPAGDAINPGSNCILTNLADALNALNT